MPIKKKCTIKKRKRTTKGREALNTVLRASRFFSDTKYATNAALNEEFRDNAALQAYLDLQRDHLTLHRQHLDLKQKIIRFLSPDQIEAAKICGCAPEIYALEWLQIYKDSLKDYAPSFADYVKSKEELRRM